MPSSMRLSVTMVLILLLSGLIRAQAVEDVDLARLSEAITWLQAPTSVREEYHYVMRGSVRLLFFWTGWDDVGIGYLRMGPSELEPEMEVIELKVGSDPEKAPMGVNRWGAAQEIHGVRHEDGRAISTSAFFGFMNASENENREEIELELASDDSDQHYRFQATLNRIEPSATVVGVAHLVSRTNFTIHQLEATTAAVLKQYRIPDVPIEPRFPEPEGAESACEEPIGFLFAVRLGIEDALSGADTREVCYLYNSRIHTLSLKNDKQVGSRRIAYTFTRG